MIDGFPRQFKLVQMAGPSARAFEDRSDAFQQLVGDGLIAMAGHHAHSYPTKGEDGSIDSYLDADAPITGPFATLPLPAIVECKDHDDSLPQVSENILGGWEKVRQKLQRQAAAGWPALFSPWRSTRTYCYAISAVFPTQDLRETLKRRITTFFRSLPTGQALGIESLQILDWNDLRFWLNRMSSVRDSWLGTGQQNVLSIRQYRAGLTGFRRFLRPDELPYVAPPRHSQHHPDAIHDQLQKRSALPGILLVGPGGVGKTRAAYEVGLRAEEAGWRVLFVLPDDPPITSEQLASVVLSQPSTRTLLVFEYLDQMQHLDLGAIRRSLMPRSRERGIEISLVANSRPTFVWKAHAERDSLFEKVEFSLSSKEAEALAEWAVVTTAPKACSILPTSEMMRVCGRRPIIALLVAQQLEHLARSGALSEESTRPLRGDDPLGHWLRKRLAEDELTTPNATSIWSKNKPPPNVVAAAAVLATTPDEPHALTAAASAALQTLSAPPDGERIVKVLSELGWLEDDGRWVHAVHDVVADEVLEQAIYDGVQVSEVEFSAVMAPAVGQARSFGRLAKSLERVYGANTNSKAAALKDAAGKWLSEHCQEIGKSIAKEAPTHGSYALGAILGTQILEEAAIARWRELVGPWLALHATDFEARHLLYRGLRTVSGTTLNELAPIGINWLARWRAELAASFLIAPLLNLRQTESIPAPLLIDWSLGWLRAFQNTQGAEFVICALLKRGDLGESAASATVSHGLKWLAIHGMRKEAGYVMDGLLRFEELTSGVVETVVNAALAWLEVHATKFGSIFVLDPLLRRKQVHGANAAIDHALVWLAEHGRNSEASRVIRSLFGRRELKDEQFSGTLRHAFAWFIVHGLSTGAQPVIASLLARRDLKGADLEKTEQTSLTWLALHSSNIEAEYLLKALLERSDLSPATADQTFTYAADWLDHHALEPRAAYVIPGILYRAQGTTFATKGIQHALDWLDLHRDRPGPAFIIPSLLILRVLSGPELKATIAHALSWLGTHSTEEVAGYVIPRLLKRRELTASELAKAIHYATDWLDVWAATRRAIMVIRALDELKLSATLKAKITSYNAVWATASRSLASDHEGRPIAMADVNAIAMDLMLRPDDSELMNRYRDLRNRYREETLRLLATRSSDGR